MDETSLIIKCPHCQTYMTLVKMVGHYGATIFVDQCKICGGIWFDELEHISAKPGEAERIDVFDPKKLLRPKKSKTESLICPRDNEKLEKFLDRKFPKDLILEHCPTCYGFWFNGGQFKKYQQSRKARLAARTEKIDPYLENQIDKMLDFQRDKKYDMLGKIGNFLSTPVTHDGIPLTAPDDWRTGPAEQVSGVAMQVITTLLRSLIRF